MAEFRMETGAVGQPDFRITEGSQSVKNGHLSLYRLYKLTRLALHKLQRVNLHGYHSATSTRIT